MSAPRSASPPPGWTRWPSSSPPPSWTGVRRDAEERATAIVMANGAAPGTACLAEVSTVAVPYSPSGTVRIRVRVAGAPDTALARRERIGQVAG